ncbi:leucine-rich repeat extensin-like protein 1 [Melia azedarach]|uniref:Leucine-rich repeat extensin-like protein 1 n=1 Tax=Melia azedarach TaxID=155640 RepID=A0ACC1XE10_MELAZ|nr:leucine-rich repeat extensin-like protein 1 [Melia azedarach]
MDHLINSALGFRCRNWCVLLLKVGILGMIMLRSVAADDDQVGVPDTGVLCISDCATCPVICSPPPPKQSYTPPISHHSPPPQSYHHSPPPPSPPPESAMPPPPPEKSEPPINSWVTPPPPPFKYNNMPPAQGPPTPGQHEYPYPYYYFYASKASFLSCHASILVVALLSRVVLFFF